MHWGIYARNEFEGAEAFRQGALALGHHAKCLSVSDFMPSSADHFDVVAVFGLQGKGPEVLKTYKVLGVPVLVIDYGYIKRTNHAHDWRTGHWQVSLGGLNRLPKGECNSQRFDALGVQVTEQGGDPDGYVLLCVQTTGDASHGMDQGGLQKWVDQQRAQWPNLLLRPHPLQEHLTYGAKICQAKTLEQALSGAKLMVTGNSNSGHDSLMAGIPSLATVAGAAWSQLSSTRLPSLESRLKHFHRCAWGQWTWAEFRTGLTHSYLMQNVLC